MNDINTSANSLNTTAIVLPHCGAAGKRVYGEAEGSTTSVGHVTVRLQYDRQLDAGTSDLNGFVTTETLHHTHVSPIS